jgi:aminoglycoside phosphotransferase (APT) family kinase protein
VDGTPRSAEIIPRLVDEIRLIEHLHTAVEFNAHIGEYRRLGAASDQFSYPFAGYRFTNGVTATDADLSRQSLQALAMQTGEWLATLHDVEPSRARDIGVTNDRPSARAGK